MSGRFLLQRNDGRSSADVSGHRVQDLHGVLQLQLLIERHDAGLGPVVSDQDPPQDPIVKLHKPERKRLSHGSENIFLWLWTQKDILCI